MKKIIALLFMINFSLGINGQVEFIRCYSHEVHKESLRTNPAYKSKREKLERYTKDIGREKAQNGNTYYIPTVFHIIHNGDTIGHNENLSPELILAQLEQLNLDFALENTNFLQAPQAFRLEAEDTRIQFCLASEDSQGNPTSGITRTNISSLGISENDCWTSTHIDQNIKDPLIWNRNKYLNVFTLNRIDRQTQVGCASDILGYGQFPGGQASSDAIVVIASSVGSRELSNPTGFPFDQGRTATHEVGHWLNLYHIWGDDQDSNDVCQGSDEVSDTPNQAGPTSGCPQFPSTDGCNNNPNGTGVMYVNYMDYSNDNCMYLFTKGQGTRMRAAITGYRNSLITSECCASHPENIWMGPSSGDWFASGTNWSLGRTPMPCDHVVINSPSQVTLKNNEVAFGYEIQVETDANLILNSGAEICLGAVQY